MTSWSRAGWQEISDRQPAEARRQLIGQYTWLDDGGHSLPLYQHIAQQAINFDAIVALPYAMPLIHYAAWAAPERTIFWPCLHNELYAFLEPIRLLMETVWGVMFNSPEDAKLANDLLGMQLPRQAVLGEGVTLPGLNRPSSEPVAQNLLYVGRLETGKNLPMLYRFVRRYAEEIGPLRLTVIGRGPVEPPRHPAFDYRGFVSDEEKALAYASTLAHCQPSLNESFSLVTMESWLAGRPVLVHEHCEVTRGHVQRSKGGLWFSHFDEFAEAVQWLQTHPDLATRMGQNGQTYVRRNYTWPAVVDRFERLIRQWQQDVKIAEVIAVR
jgi:glycosyltransferase involved in cell wall biosynthesis